MNVTRPTQGVILIECADRRGHPRLDHVETVEMDGQTVEGRDISARGLSVVLPPPVALGDVVQVRLAGCPDGGDPVKASARVVRLDAGPQGFVVGLEFLD